MRSGRLDRRIIIEQNTNTSPNTHGDVVPSWSTLATVWAEIKPIRVNERFQGQQELAQAEYKIYIRYRTDLDPKMRIQYNSEYYDILGIMEIGRKKGLEIQARRNVA